MAGKTLKDLFVDHVQDAYSSETQIAAALPKMAKAATDPALKAAFEQHLAETKVQIGRVEQVCKLLGADPGANTCEGTEGLVEEGEEVMGLGLEPGALDAGLIGAAQKVEHYEIANYGTLCNWAKRLGLTEAAGLLHQTLEEEKATDVKLTALADAQVNAKAAK